MIDKIEIVKRAKVRRAKLYYIRDKVAREIRRQMRNTIMMNVSSGSDIEEKSRAEEAVKKEEEQKEMEVANEEKTEETSKEEVLQEVSGDGKPTEEAPQEETKTDKVSSSDQSAKAD